MEQVVDAEPCAGSAAVDGRAEAALDFVRSLFAGRGVRESTSPDDVGFYCTVEGEDEIAVRYNAVAEHARLTGAAQRTAQLALLGCCPTLVESGMSVTAVMSPRTSVLFVTGAWALGSVQTSGPAR